MNELKLVPVEPQPDYIESSGRWRWPLPPQACFPGCSTDVVTASREWWEYAPSEAKPHPMSEAIEMRDGKWYWTVPLPSEAVERDAARYRKLRELYDGVDFSYGDDDSPALIFDWPVGMTVSSNLDDTLDAAMASQPVSVEK